MTATVTPVPATTDVIRMVGLQVARLEHRAEDDSESGRTLVGYAAVFDVWTEIDSFWEGHFLERLAPRAFDNTLAKRGDRVKVQFNHGFDPSIGDKPLGKASRMEPDDTGLWTETPLSRTSYNDDLIELLRDGAIDGMSFRFRVTEESWKDDGDPSDVNPRGLPERTIEALDLFEFGPVTFPAYEATSAGVRSADIYRAWRQNPDLLLPSTVGNRGTGEGSQPDDSRPAEAPVAQATKDERLRRWRQAAPKYRGVHDDS
jgi:HK97 family phage prohead protease